MRLVDKHGATTFGRHLGIAADQLTPLSVLTTFHRVSYNRRRLRPSLQGTTATTPPDPARRRRSSGGDRATAHGSGGRRVCSDFRSRRTRATRGTPCVAPSCGPPVRCCSVWHALDDGHSGGHDKYLLVVAAAISGKQQESVVGGKRQLGAHHDLAVCKLHRDGRPSLGTSKCFHSE